MTPTLPEEAVKAAQDAFNKTINDPIMVPCNRCSGKGYHYGFGEDGASPDWCVECGGSAFDVVPGEEERAMRAALTAALPFLPVQGAVKKLEWGNARITEDGREAEDAESPVGRYIATDTGWFLLGRTGYEVERGLYQAKAAAQADYEARIRSAIETVISVSEPSAARELALEEAAQIAEDYVQYDVATAIRALSSPDHADAGKVEGDGWLPIESAPKDGTVFLAVHPHGQVDFFHWQSRGPHIGWRDSFITVYPDDAGPKIWMPIPPLPSAPSEGAE
ncbi:hypothetical protein [Brucella intermedia]|uniref:hypothetical protein n=1 Tax=Brucella intermedia TaxID=94625 RepID=UPI0015920820|nr:hypothetical protein [Brucella intermedia]